MHDYLKKNSLLKSSKIIRYFKLLEPKRVPSYTYNDKTRYVQQFWDKSFIAINIINFIFHILHFFIFWQILKLVIPKTSSVLQNFQEDIFEHSLHVMQIWNIDVNLNVTQNMKWICTRFVQLWESWKMWNTKLKQWCYT